MTSVAIFAPNYFGWEPPHPQVARIHTVNDSTHPIPRDDPRLDIEWLQGHPKMDEFHGRACAAWAAHHPHLAMPDVEVTVLMGANFLTLVPDFAQRCLDELGDDDLLVMRHPWRDDIVDEAHASVGNWKWDDGRQDLFGQVASYIEAGHPRGWGLFHCGMLVRRDTPAMRAFNDAWWEEYRRWSSQNQLSLPPLLRTSDIKWHIWADTGQWRAQPFDEHWVTWGDLGVAA